jgi:hypothetical protein
MKSQKLYISQLILTLLRKRGYEMSRKKLELKPPTEEEYNRVVAKRFFGKYADKIIETLPWSLLVVKKMWKKSEEPWES